MGRKIIQAFSLFSIAVFVFIIVWFVFRAINTRSANIEQSEQKTEQIKQSIISSVLAGGGFDSKQTSRTIASSFQQNPDLKLLAIHDVEGRLDYLYAVSNAYIPKDTELGGDRLLLPELRHSGISEEQLDTRMVFPDNSVRSITTIHRVLDRADVFPIIREVLIALLSFLLITAVMIVVFPYIEKKRSGADISGAAAATEAPDEPFTPSDTGIGSEHGDIPEDTTRFRGEPGGDIDGTLDIEEQAAVETPVTNSADQSGTTVAEKAFETPVEATGEPPSDRPIEQPAATAADTETGEHTQEHSPALESHDESIESTRGLYSPNSELGWEEYLEERLNTELKRAASFDQDLVLMLISVPWARRGTQEYVAVAEMVREYFAFRDLCFEYGEIAFGAIVPNVELDQGMEKAQEFREILLPRAAKDTTPSIGLSARNGRLMSGMRLIREADRALVHARDDDDGIVAFRVDPEKYRSYIASKS